MVGLFGSSNRPKRPSPVRNSLAPASSWEKPTTSPMNGLRDLRLRRFSVVVLQHATEALAALDWTIAVGGFWQGRDELIVEPLMRALFVVMNDKLGNDTT